MKTRDHHWLKLRLEAIWKRYFPDVAVANNVFVRFGQKSKTRLGSIRNGRQNEQTVQAVTVITINGHFIDQAIPEFVVDAVLAHELTHYGQGFCSPHQQAHYHPHRGSVVKNELVNRGLENLLKSEKKWIKDNWLKYIKKYHK